ncbi:hypothetical protein IV73_GL000311 [Weissella kandleri]|uniref:Uncharacterized protein n=1 Tax=Weissella kandleri TaxID=1616 RepID=A0A0R2JNU1_9LACO|nr:hypothetical protein [Weissella kandleri]KRN75812.1 hypothetical protein IV73_GL000311 [Weissella kandleri]
MNKKNNWLINAIVILVTLGALVGSFFWVHAYLSRDSLIGKSYKTQESYIDSSDSNRRIVWNSTVDFLKNGTMIITSNGTSLNGQLQQQVVQYGRYGRPRHGNIDFILSSKYIVDTDNQASGKFGVQHSINKDYYSNQKGLSKILSINGDGNHLTLTQQNLKNDQKRQISLTEIKQTQQSSYNQRVQAIKLKNKKRSQAGLDKLNNHQYGAVLALAMVRINQSKLDEKLDSDRAVKALAHNPHAIQKVTLTEDLAHNLIKITYNQKIILGVHPQGDRLELFVMRAGKFIPVGQTKLTDLYQEMYGFSETSKQMLATYQKVQKSIVVEGDINLKTLIK